MNYLWINRYGSEILLRIGEHLILVSIAMGVAIAVGIPLGIFINRYPKLAQPILVIANAIQTIPSLAIFGFLLTIPFIGGIGQTPAIFALILYALLPIIRNTYAGMQQVDAGIKEAGTSLGMSEGQILLYIELPLALGIILTGIRLSTVICVGIATIAAAIGGGGLGVFIFRGISTVNNQLILAGALPAAIIALIADGGIGWLEKRLTQRKHQSKRLKQRLWIGLAVLGLLLFSVLGIVHSSFLPTSQAKGEVIIGSKNFTEQIILGEMLAQQIEAKTNLSVDRRFNLGGTFICHEAVKAGQIDGYVEYTGTAFTAILQQKPIKDAQQVYQQVKQAYAEKFKLEVMPSLGFENTFAIVIRKEDAQKFSLKTISDAAPYTSQWKAGFGYEFIAREDGYPGLAKTYNLQFSTQPQAMEIGLMYQALSKKQVDFVAGNSTDGLIKVLNLVILEDNKRYFPPYEAIPVFNQKTFDRYPQLKKAIAQLSGSISAQAMQQLNYQIDNQARSVEEVVRDYLHDKKL